MPLPGPEGVVAKKLEPQDGIEYHTMRLSSAVSLTDLAVDYVFFTPALLFTHGEWVTDPIEDYIREDKECCPFQLNLPRPAFTGLTLKGDEAWNYRIMACLKPQWTGRLEIYLFQLGGVNFKRRLYHRMMPQNIRIPDLLALEKMTILPSPVPMVDVIAFGIDGNRGRIGLVPASNPPVNQARVIKLGPTAETIQLAKAVLANNPRPFSAVQKTVGDAYVEMLARSRKRKQLVSEKGLIT
jgi:hypothetical protein